MNSERIQYHRKYFEDYYGNEFIPGQGIEEIFDAIYKFGQNGTWLDLGGGTNTYFWRIPFKTVELITSMDIDEEAFLVLNEIRSKMYNDGCYKYAFNLFSKDVNEVYNTPLKFIQADLLNQSIESYTKTKYDNITQFGLWGLLKTKEQYLYKLNEAIDVLNKNGVLICANWVWRIKLTKKRGYDNSYLTKKLIEEYCTANRKKLLYITDIFLNSDPEYSHVIIYVISR